MPTQEYRGYRIDVSCAKGEDFPYRTSITTSKGLQVEFEVIVMESTNVFQNGVATEDEAFTSARAWIESHPAPGHGVAHPDRKTTC